MGPALELCLLVNDAQRCNALPAAACGDMSLSDTHTHIHGTAYALNEHPGLMGGAILDVRTDPHGALEAVKS